MKQLPVYKGQCEAQDGAATCLQWSYCPKVCLCKYIHIQFHGFRWELETEEAVIHWAHTHRTDTNHRKSTHTPTRCEISKIKTILQIYITLMVTQNSTRSTHKETPTTWSWYSMWFVRTYLHIWVAVWSEKGLPAHMQIAKVFWYSAIYVHTYIAIWHLMCVRVYRT
jgi:hypothetical protein